MSIIKKKIRGIIGSWVITDEYLKVGLIFKRKIPYSEIKDIKVTPAEKPKDIDFQVGYMDIRTSDGSAVVWFRYDNQEEARKAFREGIVNSSISDYKKNKLKSAINKGFNKEKTSVHKPLSKEEWDNNYNNYKAKYEPQKTPKDASVVGRAIVGGIIAGPAGAIVGAVSAADKNNKNRNSGNNSQSKPASKTTMDRANDLMQHYYKNNP